MILERLKSLVDQYLIYEGDFTPEMRMMEDLGADSFDIPMLIDAVEEEFHVTITDQELLKIRTIGDIIAIIEERLQ